MRSLFLSKNPCKKTPNIQYMYAHVRNVTFWPSIVTDKEKEERYVYVLRVNVRRFELDFRQGRRQGLRCFLTVSYTTLFIQCVEHHDWDTCGTSRTQ